MEGNLTSRINNIANIPCYNYIIKNCFNNIDILNHNKTTINILNNDCRNFISLLHSIQSSLLGCYLDYLLRRIISEQINILFFDSRADKICNLNIASIKFDNKEFIFDKLPIKMSDCYEKTKNTGFYNTKDILLEIFITSLSHTFSFCGIPDQDKVNNIINIIQNTENIIELLYLPLQNLCSDLLNNNYNDVLLNQALGYKIPLLNNKCIPSDCDLIINNNLYDIKCTNKKNSIYEILQLLGYSSLLKCNSNINRKIDNICIINLLQGKIISYNINYINDEQIINYLKILTK
jgi:hypothetical protein